ncbi:phosphoribosylglycinamide formyltransferase [Mycetocola reblochoni]|uniref:Phosphoribosylglycinamide formyltransferase n=2 Tax=Mycetocola reblochoni TaxID=331618 RepID=A0A1R4KB59_9MICO|nr:phosphoribosylglycinamide formyltransferase [Mycetocola reblochoni]RLP69237.1 phosphoribosylglycinamide formyltransferase [Mycetocola reblochoni]SJN41537.1 Phosphoribosylglycinamide formyltransferase [Mycetocola reblochoni REB411]
MLSVVVLISGTGSNLRALIEAAAEPGYPARIVAVGADRDAAGLAHATAAGIPVFTVPYSAYPSRADWGEALRDAIDRFAPDLVVLSGLMRLLPPSVVEAYAPRLINTHPAYLPEFPGAHAVRDALAAGADRSGASIIVVDSGVDTGSIIVRERVDVLPGDTEDSLHERIKPVERRLLIDAVRRIADGDIDLSDPAAPASQARHPHR